MLYFRAVLTTTDVSLTPLSGGTDDLSSIEDALLRPAHLVSSSEVLGRSCPVPAAAGVYAWYFAPPPTSVPIDGCHTVDGWTLLYVGISPKAPPSNGTQPSRQTIRKRIRYHYRGNAYGSTLRLTLGCLLATELDIQLRRVGSGTRMTFGPMGERRLTDWMAGHARVAWVTTAEPWTAEATMIKQRVLPLNLDQNRHCAFHQHLSAARADQRAGARSLPVLTATPARQ
ncbi:hypothetical protein Adi01nite_10850 [Amorphoplanes digitatis]|nr:hypothetical protein Adi01nite_10850 [Actinoplanes digitatis]